MVYLTVNLVLVAILFIGSSHSIRSFRHRWAEQQEHHQQMKAALASLTPVPTASSLVATSSVSPTTPSPQASSTTSEVEVETETTSSVGPQSLPTPAALISLSEFANRSLAAAEAEAATRVAAGNSVVSGHLLSDPSSDSVYLFVGILFPKSLFSSVPGLESKMTALANASTPSAFFRVLGLDVESGGVIGDTDREDERLNEHHHHDHHHQHEREEEGESVVTFSDLPVLRNVGKNYNSHIFLKQASCEPEMRTMDLSSYTRTSLDPDTVAFPACIRVPRCGGCCGPSNLLQCLPTRTTIREVPRVLQRLNAGSKDQKNTIEEKIEVEFHEACACQCRIQEKDCDLNTHVYDKETCSCRCPDSQAHATCLMNGKKTWDPSDCSCRCLHPRRCSTGLFFSHETCSCQMMSSSL